MSVASVGVDVPDGWSIVSIAGFDIWECVAPTRLDIQGNKIFYQLMNLSASYKSGYAHVWVILERTIITNA